MKVALTQSNLLKLKKRMKIAQEGYNLLDEKREVMIMELMRNIRGFKEMEEEITRKLQEAYNSLEKTVVSKGKQKITNFAKGGEEPSVDVRMRSVLGIPVPELLVDVPEIKVLVSLDSTDEYFDEALDKFSGLIDLLARWAAKEVLIWRLGSEISKTQKRVNALEKIFIPEYKTDIKKIEENLEDEEREEFFRVKRLSRGE
ncbi:MAG: V-type ATP synthase subunit D [candidate division WOR-3 bacterium]